MAACVVQVAHGTHKSVAELDAGVLDHLGPFGHLLPDDRRKLGWRVADRFEWPVRIIGLRRLRGQQHKQCGEQVATSLIVSLPCSACPFGRALLQHLEGSLARQPRLVQFRPVAGVARMSGAISRLAPSPVIPASRCAHAGYPARGAQAELAVATQPRNEKAA
jgi:hypothetical protein